MTAMLLLAALTPAAAFAGPATQTGDEMEQLRQLSGADFEKEFLTMMVHHHMDALDMSNMALTRANHAEVKAVAQQIIDDQQREIDQMTAWLQQWYSATPGHHMGSMDMSMMQKLESLSGDDFDKEFLVQMRMHHMSAVEMAELVPSRATHDELKTLAQNIISSQTAEIGQFESWLMSWYNADPTGAAMPGMGNMPAAQATPTAQPSMPATGADNQFAFIVALMLMAVTMLAGGLLLAGRSRRSGNHAGQS